MTYSAASEQDSALYRLADVSIQDARSAGVTLGDMAAGRCPGIIIRDFYNAGQIALLRERLERIVGGGPLPVQVSHAPCEASSGDVPLPHYLGLDLVFARPDLKDYLRLAGKFRAFAAGLFEDLPPFERELATMLETLAPGRLARCPMTARGELYGPAAIRIFPPGADSPTHCGNSMLRESPQFGQLRQLAGETDQLSFFMTITAPAAGGELVLYDLEWEASGGRLRDSVRLDESLTRGRRRQPLNIGEGDLIIFNGGRIYHSVSRVEGTQARHTIGGFISLSRDPSTVYYYS